MFDDGNIGTVGFFPALGVLIWVQLLPKQLRQEHIEHLVKPVKTYLELYFCVCRMLLIPDAL
jgi:hypothetical protein